ncbi:hypothetical protein BN874_1130004 [Candidatus Contendobacter odensis Run_B_J11]|uniref:Uncharacterized protein n=1 Tax=Candidatus Contendobacter odensis Run_B_J11 TaxID=1400861 RepID=A0A7U7G857_9GAMM|nr:hypothetical protein BN874_1130004 [Candidatus Contendobacter odensis Run_B_J11]
MNQINELSALINQTLDIIRN